MLLAKLILMAVMAANGNGTSTAAPTATAPTSQPATRASDPREVITDFLKGLEALPAQERQGYKCGSGFKVELSKNVSDEAVDTYSTRYGRGLANLSSEEIATLRETMVSAWAALVHYYQGHLLYDKSRDVVSISMPGSTDPKPFRMVVPTSGPAYPGPVEFLVEVIEEKGIWKINNVRILPLGRNETPKSDSGK